MNGTVIFVLGMGRSGTSAIARVLSLCGAALPSGLLGANAGNPRGHWEPLEALNINDAFLAKRSSSWYDPTFRLQRETIPSQDESDFVDQIRQFLVRSIGDKPLVIKEPRITALTRYWFKAAEELGLKMKVVIAVRHPNEVSASLIARDRISAELANVLYVKYTLLAERGSRGHQRTFVGYTNLLDDWRKELGRVSRTLSLQFTTPDVQGIGEFLSPDLRRQNDAGAPADQLFGMNWLSTIHSTLSAAASDAPWESAKLDVIFETFGALEATFYRAFDEFRNITSAH